MKIIIFGADSYIGRKLLAYLHNKEYELVAVINDKTDFSEKNNSIDVITKEELFFKDVDIEADKIIYFPFDNENIHGQKFNKEVFLNEFLHFKEFVKKSNIDDVILFSTILHDENLFCEINEELKKDNLKTIWLKTDIVIGSGSPEFEIIREIIETIPVFLIPYWLKTYCNVIGIDDLLKKIPEIIKEKKYSNKELTIGNKEKIRVKQVFSNYAETRGMLRLFFPTLFFSTIFCGFLLSGISNIKYSIIKFLLKKLKSRYKKRKLYVCPDIQVSGNCRYYIFLALGFVSSSIIRTRSAKKYESKKDESYAFEGFDDTPVYGCKSLLVERELKDNIADNVIKKIKSIGFGKKLFYLNWLWHFKGWTNWLTDVEHNKSHPFEIVKGDKMDFWIVQFVNNDNFRVLLYSDLFLPGEGWLEFRVLNIGNNRVLQIKQVFRPLGFSGRVYWFFTKPLHYFIMNKIIKAIIKK